MAIRIFVATCISTFTGVHGSLDALTDMLVDRSLHSQPALRGDLEKTTLAKAQGLSAMSHGTAQAQPLASHAAAANLFRRHAQAGPVARTSHLRSMGTNAGLYHGNVPLNGREAVSDLSPILEARLQAFSAEHMIQTRVEDVQPLFQPALTVRPAVSADEKQLTGLMNVARRADTALLTDTEDEHIQLADTRAMLHEEWSADGGPVQFLVAEEGPDAIVGRTQKPALVGCVRLSMPTLVARVDDAPSAPGKPAFTAQLDMLAVAPGARGVSSLLLGAAEKQLVKAASEAFEWMWTKTSETAPGKLTLRIVVPVISERSDLVAFYSDHGYKALRLSSERKPRGSHTGLLSLVSSPQKETNDGVELPMLYKDIDVEEPHGAMLRLDIA